MSSAVSEVIMENPPKFTQLNNLASSCNGAKVLFATDDFFAVAECLLADTEPIFDPHSYTEFGKQMDGWETRRKRIAGHDWCIIKLAGPCTIEGILADTAHFTGNYVPKISVQAAQLTDDEEQLIPKRVAKIGTACTDDDLKRVTKLGSHKWQEIVKLTHLRSGIDETRHSYISVDSPRVYTHIRLNYFPDGGVARFKVYGTVKVDFTKLHGTLVDLMCVLNGTVCYGFSNAHFGHPSNLIKPFKGESMADGWETARRLDRPPVLECDADGALVVTGSEYALFRLGTRGKLEKIVIDTNHFKGNFPDHVQIEGVEAARTELIATWKPIITNFKLSAHREHVIDAKQLKSQGPFTHIKVTMMPDGGMSRIRIFGYPRP